MLNSTNEYMKIQNSKLNKNTNDSEILKASLYGYIKSSELPKLFDRLLGLSENINGYSGKQNYAEHVISFIPSVETPIGPDRNNDVIIKINCNLLDENYNYKANSILDNDWTINLVGNPDSRITNCIVKPIRKIKTNGNIFEFLKALGYKFHFEYLQRGFIFGCKNIRIKVVQTYQIKKQYDLSTAKHLKHTKSIWLVEAYSTYTKDNVKIVIDELITFASYLKGIVDLTVIDHHYVQQRINYVT